MIKEYIYNQLNEAMFFAVDSIEFSKMSDDHILINFHKNFKRDEDILLSETRVINPKLYKDIFDFVHENSYIKENPNTNETFTKFKIQSPERKYTISCEFSVTTHGDFQALTLIPIKKVHTAIVSS